MDLSSTTESAAASSASRDAAPAFGMKWLTPAAGAEITGIDLSATLDEATVAALRRALTQRGVLFFRDQPITPDRQVAFARRFGHVPPVPDSMFSVHPDNRFVSVLENDAEHPPTVNNWHSDYSFAAEPDFASVLRSVDVPPVGGDTLWVGMAAAYEGLSDAMKTRLDGLTATHDFMKLYEHSEEGAVARRARPPGWKRRADSLRRSATRWCACIRKPAARYCSSMNRSPRHVDGLSEAESRSLFGYLFEHLKAPEFQVRFHWTADCVAMWDNRATTHYAVADFYPEHRLMHRVTVLERARARGLKLAPKPTPAAHPPTASCTPAS